MGEIPANFYEKFILKLLHDFQELNLFYALFFYFELNDFPDKIYQNDILKSTFIFD